MDFWNNSIYSLLSTWICTWTEPEPYFDKKNHAWAHKCHLDTFFWKGWDDHALLVPALTNPSEEFKIIFVLGSYESQERLEGKTRKGPFF